MPPSVTPPVDPRDHLLPPHQTQKAPIGPVVGTVIIVILLVIGALYFWGAHLNSQKSIETIPSVLEEDLTVTP